MGSSGRRRLDDQGFRLPAPAKWLLSENAGARVPFVQALSNVQDEICSVHCAEKPGVLRIYRSLARVESEVLAPAPPPHGMWWRKDFTERLPNLARLPDHRDLRPWVQSAAALFRDLV